MDPVFAWEVFFGLCVDVGGVVSNVMLTGKVSTGLLLSKVCIRVRSDVFSGMDGRESIKFGDCGARWAYSLEVM